MLHSVRARLTAWYAAVFALFELVFAVASYGFLARATGARVDEGLAETAGAVAQALAVERAAGAFPLAAVTTVMREFRLGGAAVAVLDRRSGVAVIAFEVERASADRRRRAELAAPPDFRRLLRAAPDVPALVTVDTRGAPVRVFTQPYRYAGRELVVGAAESLAPQRRTLGEARTALLVVAPLLLGFAAAGGYALARESLRPVAVMTGQAARIGAGTLHERVPVHNPRDELGQLAAVFNALLGRLQDAFERQRRFMADASHELRTPVSIIGGEAELALAREGRDAGELRAALTTIGEEAERLARIVADLFLLARADAGEQPVVREELYLADLAADAARAVRTLAARKGITVTVDADGDLPFRGDEGLLRRLVLNLLDNAIKYTPAGGQVTVTAAARDGHSVLEVADTGPGIPAEARAHIFDRFFRVERGSGASAGAGLGLSIARWIAEAHGGRLELTRSDEGGSTFTVTLPVSPAGRAVTGAER